MRVTATYSTSSTLQSAGLLEQIRVAVNAQLPLRNLHWKSPSRPSIRTVQELNVDLVPYDAGKDQNSSPVLGAVKDRALLNIYLVACEDADTYKALIKKQLKDWHTLITQRKNQEWLLVHIVPPDARAASGPFLKMKGSLLDKIRADFNTDKRDRCVQLAWSPDKDNPAAWVDFVTKMKEGILTAFDSVVSQREEEVKRSEGQRQMPGWNFCTYFILKESLAVLLEGMSLFEDALTQYDELEFTFTQVLREKNLSWFGKLISPAPKDDSSPLLSLVKKPYRDLILANTISVFDLRIYLLARQCAIFGTMGKVVDAAKKSSAFLAFFSRRLREVEGTLPKFFIESWIYSSAVSVVEQCDTWARSFDFDKPTLTSYQAAKGELLQLAVNQLDIIGVSVGHLPPEIPFSASIPSSAPTSNGVPDTDTSLGLSKPEIISAVSEKDFFYDLYVNAIKRAIDLFAKSGRRQFALKLHGTLAALDVHRGRLAKAQQTYSSLPGHYIPHGWISLGCHMHLNALDIHSRLEKPRDRDWLYLVLDFLKAYVADFSQEFLIRDEDEQTYMSDLIDSLRAAAASSDTDIQYSDHTAITLQLQNASSTLAGSQDGSFLEVTIRNHLPCKFLIDEVRIVLICAASERMVFSVGQTLLVPGSNIVKVFCASSTSGSFLFHSYEISVSNIILQWSHKQQRRHPHLSKDLPVMIQVPKDPEAVDVIIGQPRSIVLGASQCIQVTVYSRRNHVVHMKLQFSHAGIKFDYVNAASLEPGSAKHSMQPTQDSLFIRDIQENGSVSVLLPHSDASGYNAIKINVQAKYTTLAEPKVERALSLSRIVPTSLAIAVNVEDFFRDERLLTRFTISTTTHQHVRIKSAHLEIVDEPKNNLKIFPCTRHRPESVTATPTQSCHFLFSLKSLHGRAREPLQLRITYRVLRQEVETLIEQSVMQVVAKSPALLPHRRILIESLVTSLESDAKWVALYGITGELESPPTAVLDGELDAAIRETKEILLKNNSNSFGDTETWREIIFPVDVPEMHIIAAVRIRILSNSQMTPNGLPPLYAGQPIPAVLTIRTSFHWGPVDMTENKEKTYMMRFDVEELLEDWLVSGQKRGDFVAKHGETFSISITLIALHHGKLSLPRASVTPLPVAGAKKTMGSVVLPGCNTFQEHGAEKVLVLPRGGRSTFLVDMGGIT